VAVQQLMYCTDLQLYKALLLGVKNLEWCIAGNAVVDGVVASNFGAAAHLPVANTFAVEHAAGAKMRLVHRAAPWLLRLLHRRRLLTPLHDGISAIGRQVPHLSVASCAQSTPTGLVANLRV
jgi:hypothetical protein